MRKIGDQIMEIILRHQKIGRRAARARLAVSLLKDVEVPNAESRLDDYPHQYSGGMRQRVMIAIALANEPDLLIADEPTTALDVTTQAQVLDVLEKLVAERDTAVLLITHNLGVVAEFCDHVFVMYAGRVVERGDADQVFARQTHPYTETLLRSVPRPDRLQRGPLPVIPGFPPSLANLPPGLHVRAPLPASATASRSAARPCRRPSCSARASGPSWRSATSPSSAGRASCRCRPRSPRRRCERAERCIHAPGRPPLRPRGRDPVGRPRREDLPRARRQGTPRGRPRVVRRQARGDVRRSSASPAAASRRSRAASCACSSRAPAASP